MDTIENDNWESQLRSLRLILGQNFKPISTEALATLTKIPLVSIRAIEAGRRALNNNDRDAFDLLLGARWSPDLHQWVCAEAVPERPFCRMEFTHYINQRLPARLADIKQKARSEEIDILLSNLQDQEAALARCRIHREVCQIAMQHNLAQQVLESIESRSPILQSKPNFLSAKTRAAIAQALRDVEDSEKSRTPAGKKRKAQK